jgi:hypothetical protein
MSFDCAAVSFAVLCQEIGASSARERTLVPSVGIGQVEEEFTIESSGGVGHIYEHSGGWRIWRGTVANQIEIVDGDNSPVVESVAETLSPDIEIVSGTLSPDIEIVSGTLSPEMESVAETASPDVEILAEHPSPEVEIVGVRRRAEVEILVNNRRPDIEIVAEIPSPVEIVEVIPFQQVEADYENFWLDDNDQDIDPPLTAAQVLVQMTPNTCLQ